MDRRQFLVHTAMAPVLLASASSVAANGSSGRHHLGLVIHSYWVRRDRPLDPDFGSIAEPVAFVELAARLGAPGVQTNLTSVQSPSRLKDLLDQHAMYVEGTIGLPRDESDVARFERDLTASKAAGAMILRTVCLSGRRYETFKSAGQFREFADRSWTSLTLAEPIAAKHRIMLAVENHKDWRIEEMLGWLKKLSSEFVGVCLDTGNSMALLEDPMEVVEAYAPWTMTTHLKDMAVAESPDGFLLSEVPLGTGVLDLPRVVSTLRKFRPRVNLNLEMITRDPLSIPCLTTTYWSTMSEVHAPRLASMLKFVRDKGWKQPLPRISQLDQLAKLKAEASNINQCIDYARQIWK